jgi:L-ribulose-5-phosphate 3-epimerase UlaE
VVREMSLKTFDVYLEHHLDRSHVIVRARSADEAMDQGVLVLNLTYRDVRFMSAMERTNPTSQEDSKPLFIVYLFLTGPQVWAEYTSLKKPLPWEMAKALATHLQRNHTRYQIRQGDRIVEEG